MIDHQPFTVDNHKPLWIINHESSLTIIILRSQLPVPASPFLQGSKTQTSHVVAAAKRAKPQKSGRCSDCLRWRMPLRRLNLYVVHLYLHYRLITYFYMFVSTYCTLFVWLKWRWPCCDQRMVAFEASLLEIAWILWSHFLVLTWIAELSPSLMGKQI